MLADFKRLADEHRARLRVSWMVTERGDVMSLRNQGAKGNGAIAMRELCALADRLGVTLTLATSADRLKPYYEAFGFRMTRATEVCASYRVMFFKRPANQGASR